MKSASKFGHRLIGDAVMLQREIMKNMYYCFFIFLISTQILGDGIPVNKKGEILVPHIKLNLLDFQIEELEILGSVTLSTQQYDLLKTIGNNVPKRFNTILSINYDDCTCGIGLYAIQTASDSIAIINKLLQRDPKSELQFKVCELQEDVNFYVDSESHINFNGITLSDEQIVEVFQYFSKIKEDLEVRKHKYAIFNYSFNQKRDEKLEERINKISTSIKSAGWSVFK